MGGEGILAQQKNQMKRFNTITAATAVIGSIVSIGIMQRPVMARCGDGLVPDPNGGNFCVPKARQIQTLFLDYALHELSITGRYQSKVGGQIEWILLHR